MFRPPSRKRRLLRLTAVVAVGLLLAVLVGGFLWASLRPERIRWYAVDVVVLDDGSALVRETIDYDFGSALKHGVLRAIPEDAGADATGAVKMSDVAVRSASAPDDVSIRRYAGLAEIRVGDPHQTVTGRHRYVIDYRLTGVVVDGRLAIDAIGTRWPVPIEAARIRMTAPFTLDALTCDQGERAARARCDQVDVDGNRLTVLAEGLNKEQGVTLYAQRGRQVPDPATALPAKVDLSGSDPGWPARAIGAVLGVGVVGYVIGVVLATRWARRAGRDLAWHGEGGPVDAVFGGPGMAVCPIDDAGADDQATIQFVPPPDLTPAQGGVLLHEEVTNDHRIAWLVQHAADGWFTIDDSGEKLELAVPRERLAKAPRPLKTIFKRSRTVSLKSRDRRFARGWQAIGKELTRWQHECGLWDSAARGRSMKTRKLLVRAAVLAGVAGGVGLMFTTILPLWTVLPLAALSSVAVGAGVAARANVRELAVRTPAGFAQRQLVAGFRRFFEVSEGRHAREAADKGVLRLYSAWAVALGELDRWKRAMTDAALPPSTPGTADIHAISVMSVGSYGATGSGTSGAVVSLGGVGAGGGVGGGAGGGGGGSW